MIRDWHHTLMSMACGRRRMGGFTLVEMLVVVSIVALLLSILLPGLSAAREYSRQTACAANMRNIGVGLLVAENGNNTLPKAAYIPEPLGWNGLPPVAAPPIYRVLEGDAWSSNQRGYVCPSDGSDVGDLCGTSYFYNALSSLRWDNISSDVAIMWDADDTQVLTLGTGDEAAVLKVGPFHERRNILHGDLHVDQQASNQVIGWGFHPREGQAD